MPSLSHFLSIALCCAVQIFETLVENMVENQASLINWRILNFHTQKGLPEYTRRPFAYASGSVDTDISWLNWCKSCIILAETSVINSVADTCFALVRLYVVK